MSQSFEQKLEAGLVAESLIARWLVRRGWTILPAYEKELGRFKGPRVYSAKGNLIAPDMLAFRCNGDAKEIHWVEAKSKSAFTWHRKSKTYQDGIDKRHWLDYLQLTPWPVWLLFLHAPGQVAKDNPPGMVPPTGLYGGRVDVLKRIIDHPYDGMGSGGMVYWTVASLSPGGRPIATGEEVTGEITT